MENEKLKIENGGMRDIVVGYTPFFSASLRLCVHKKWSVKN